MHCLELSHMSCLEINNTFDLCLFCVLVAAQGGERCLTIHKVKIAVHSAKGCCTATPMALTSIQQKSKECNSSRIVPHQHFSLKS